MVQAVIFDVDGTLIDSVDLHAKAWQEIFLKYGVRTDFHAVRAEIGKGGDKLMKVFLSQEQLAREGEEIDEERTKLFQCKYLSQVRPFPELKSLFERLRDNGIKIALASSAKDDELQVYKKVTGIGTFLEKETSADDVANSKPAPDIFSVAQKTLGIDPRHIIAIGDSEYDAESAGKAGMDTIGLLCGGSTAAKLQAAGCIALYRDPADLLKNYATSPLAKRQTKSEALGDITESDEKEKTMSSKNALFLMGLGLGVVAGMLYAPKSGSEARGFLKNKADEAKKYAEQAMADADARAKQKTEELKKSGADSVEAGKQGAQVEALTSAVDAGKKTYGEAGQAAPDESAI